MNLLLYILQYNIVFSLSLAPGLPVLILTLLSLHVPILVVPSPYPSHMPMRIMKSHIFRHTLPLHHVAIHPSPLPLPSPHPHPTTSSLHSIYIPCLPITEGMLYPIQFLSDHKNL
jgi:hypothetical protein